MLGISITVLRKLIQNNDKKLLFINKYLLFFDKYVVILDYIQIERQIMAQSQRYTLAAILRACLNIVRWLLLIGGIVLVGQMVFTLLGTIPITSDFPIPVHFTLDSARAPITVSSPGVERVELLTAFAALDVSCSNKTWIAVALPITVLIFAFLWITLTILWRIMQTAATGAPFVPENVRRFRNLGLLILASELLFALLVYLIEIWIYPTLTIEGVILKAKFDINFASVLLGLFMLVMAEVFRRGTTLEDDQSLTV